MADVPRDGGTLYRRLGTDVATLNPLVGSNRDDRYVANYLFTPLIQLDRTLQPIAGLAKSWKISPDGTIYRFDLNERATFADGTPVRASDVVFTLRKIVDPANEAMQIYGSFELLDLSRTRVIDDHVVEVAFRTPLATQLTRFSDVFVLPQHVYANGDFLSGFGMRAIGSGPYRLVRRNPGKEIVIERRSDYWGERPYIQTVIFKVVSDHNTAWNALKRGDIDETLITSDRWTREQNNPAVRQNIELLRFYTINYNVIAWNNRKPLLANKQVRRALAMCIPLESIIRSIFNGNARAMTGPFTPDQWACNPSVPVISYDPSEARKTFVRLGWLDRNGDGILEKDGKPFSIDLIITSGNAPAQQVGQLLQAEWKKVGLNVHLVTLDGAAAIQRIIGGNYDAAYIAWDLDADPDPYAQFHSSQMPPRGQNVVFYSNPEADRLIERARRELDQEKRKALYWRLHEVLAVDQPYAWTIQAPAKWGIRKRVRGVETSRGTGFFSWYPGELGWWLATDGQAQ
jgi:peptide/nickel transport system substrate-binding protein